MALDLHGLSFFSSPPPPPRLGISSNDVSGELWFLGGWGGGGGGGGEKAGRGKCKL